jgi:hypothetical protein
MKSKILLTTLIFSIPLIVLSQDLKLSYLEKSLNVEINKFTNEMLFKYNFFDLGHNDTHAFLGFDKNENRQCELLFGLTIGRSIGLTLDFLESNNTYILLMKDIKSKYRYVGLFSCDNYGFVKKYKTPSGNYVFTYMNGRHRHSIHFSNMSLNEKTFPNNVLYD